MGARRTVPCFTTSVFVVVVRQTTLISGIGEICTRHQGKVRSIVRTACVRVSGSYSRFKVSPLFRQRQL
ncbi:hypothetical protein [Oryza sativa Japonica Group]|uniref:Secreted protein n=1 Tax=Oryza sativa subsp. japonica TaxID=39947 RepID=Q5VP03_ORYSJ|nr:hypothetical protein [Oryza sativa Japonica Group]